MSERNIVDLVWEVVKEAAKRGPGWSQEGVVLRKVGEQLGMVRGDLRTQQAVLNVWHDLFAAKKLGWGYDLDNPGSPFFHIRETNG